jgi:hypothetical protein
MAPVTDDAAGESSQQTAVAISPRCAGGINLRLTNMCQFAPFLLLPEAAATMIFPQ